MAYSMKERNETSNLSAVPDVQSGCGCAREISQARHALVRRNVQYHNPLGIFPAGKPFPSMPTPPQKACLRYIFTFCFFLEEESL